MGLVFQVGQASEVFLEEFAPRVDTALERAFGYVTPALKEDHFCTDDLAWSAWAKLQTRMRAELGQDAVKTMLAFEAWQAVFLPLEIEATRLEVSAGSDKLNCASLPRLHAELEAFHAHFGLPITKNALLERRTQLEESWDDDDFEEDEFSTQQLLNELLLATLEATRRNQPLWVVK